jgi:dipeptidyl-peptidase-4
MAKKSIANRARLYSTAAFTLLCVAAKARAAEPCFESVAATRGYALGMPAQALPLPDGHAVLYLHSGPRDTKLGLYEYRLDTHANIALAKPDAAPEHLSVEEKARRERARMTLTGITSYALSEDGKLVLVAQADKLSTITLADAAIKPVPGAGWIGPLLAPDGSAITAVRDNDVHVVDLATGKDTAITSGGTDILTHGLAEFAAEEELGRLDGTWWSPDSSKLVYEEADSSGLEKHFIADPAHPDRQPVEFRYPRAGTPNAKLRLGIVARTGGPTTWISWDSTAFPYVARVLWRKDSPLTLVVLNRESTEERVLTVDPATGATKTLLTETDKTWLNLSPDIEAKRDDAADLPYYLPKNGGFLWASERSGHWQLELHKPDGSLDHTITPDGQNFVTVDDVDAADASVVVTAQPDRLTTAVYRIKLAGGAETLLTPARGLHSAVFSAGQHDVFIDGFSRADGGAGDAVLDRDGKLLAQLPSYAELPPAIPKVTFTTAGSLNLDAAILRPSKFKPGQKYPVVLSVYAGPGVKVVHEAARHYLEDQCLADEGFIVASLDGRGTPGRDHDFERATKFNLIDLPLQDQVDGLRALGKRFPEMDMSRVGVTGWSFGGYFTAMATIRRPDVFKAGVAGAPVVDFQDYDTAYTERYLGIPQVHPEAYKASNVLTYADQLSRPLLIIHGLTDDNVYFQNSVKLTQALLAAGKPYNLLLLPGTHQLPDPKLRARVDDRRAAFLKENLH